MKKLGEYTYIKKIKGSKWPPSPDINHLMVAEVSENETIIKYAGHKNEASISPEEHAAITYLAREAVRMCLTLNITSVETWKIEQAIRKKLQTVLFLTGGVYIEPVSVVAGHREIKRN